MRLKKTSVLAALAALQLAMVPAAMADAPDGGRISVTGLGRVDVAPDMAVITLGVATRGDTAAEALRENNTRLAAVLERLQGAGIAERDLQTSGLTMGPQFDYSRDGAPPRLTGYEVSNQVTVRVRDLSGLGGILDQAVGDGANTFHGLSFALSEPEPALDEARIKAVRDARRKAEAMAEAAGVRLGALVSMSESAGLPEVRPMARMDMAVAASSVPVQAGEVGYTVSVSAVWALETD